MLDVQSLAVSYGQHQALDGAGIHVGRGEIVVILGANGAGKSSLLKAISGISEGKVTGSVTMQGHELVGMAPDKIVEAGIALVPEGRGVFPDLNVQENLKLGSHNSRAREEEEANLNRVLSLFPKLGERRRQIVRTMSGGEQQMVAVGRAMMSSPAILTLDEPSLGLSPLLCKDLFQSLKAVRDTGIGILLVEQNAKQSLAIADRGYLLENGRIVHEAKAEDLMNDPAVQKAYLGGATAGGHTAPTPAAAPSRPAAPVPSAPSRPAAQNPSDIAAAAIQSVSRPSARPAAPAPTAPPPQPAATPAPRPAPTVAPAPVPAAASNSAGSAQNIDINDLVSRARSTSAGRVSPRSNGASHPPAPMPPMNGSARTNGSASHSALPSSQLKMPDLTDSRDRLQSVLNEIEEAAARARAYRPNQDR